MYFENSERFHFLCLCRGFKHISYNSLDSIFLVLEFEKRYDKHQQNLKKGGKCYILQNLCQN